ncbi:MULTISPECIES: DoxX family membrane protein [unclassified Polaromonas]|nr:MULTISPECIES: DoxX family membrane protein [unclassified Polaromonas]HQS41287.1 DoxX family membrane protein [Polaromonas sp.]HQS88497.1 DoxX family membrane protein [Polaromonas sp.]
MMTSNGRTAWLARGLNAWGGLTRTLNTLQPAAALLARLYIAQVFFLSGLTKLRDWDTTVALFTDEYHVPLLPPAAAALMGTAGELVLPVLLVLGLFVVNAVAVISLSEIAPAALQQHVFWGTLLAGLAIYGAGPWSLDRWLAPALQRVRRTS